VPCRANGAPYVTEKDAVVIYPGESFAVAVDVDRGKVADPRPASDEGEPGTIALKFSAIDSGMMLTITNNLAGMVKYDATMKGPDGRVVYTSSCPIDAALTNFESWPHPIKYLELTNFRILPEGSDRRCD
jgi:hypothetical protein